MIRSLLALILFVGPANAAPVASRVASAAPGHLPVLAPSLGAAGAATPSLLSSPSLAEGGLPSLVAPVFSAESAPAAASPAAPAQELRPKTLSAAHSGILPARAVRPFALFSKGTPAANPADRTSPSAKETAAAIAQKADRAPPTELEKRMRTAFDGGGPKSLHVLMTAGEANPYIKTGGLADVVGDVGPGLVRAGHKVSLVIPLYASISPQEHGLRRLPGAFAVPVAGRIETARLWTKKEQGVDVYFIEHEEFFGRHGAYGYQGADYLDNDERFIFHSRAALEAMRFLDTPPDIVHAHDWHVGLIPPYLKLIYNKDPFFAATRSVMTIHNIAYQGTFAPQTLEKAGFRWEDFTFDKLEYHGNLSFLKAGIAFADAVTTVSPNYAKEIQTEEFGMGLQGLLAHRAQELIGILNGIDPDFYNPKKDPRIAHHYGPEDVVDGKSKNKLDLQSKRGLARKPHVPVFGVASRLADQKGIDLVAQIIEFIVKRGGQVVITGSGDANLEQAIDSIVKQYPNAVLRNPFDTIFVHTVYAVSDFLLMPSRFEPCGLSQMMAHAYGGLPIATRVGGLADSVIDIDENSEAGNGFFVRDFTVDALKDKIAAAFALYDDPTKMTAAQRRAMAVDHSWSSSLDAYNRLYHSLLGSDPRKN
ncbi:MAG: glycogen synthase [Elusimicrobia bacterium CG_4_9_14_3_um_filter_62_55]|nr:MAG: glycogen synthase [Elusimicrobia bacterium CG22_combo_CG10-13_8_21_14_all_63_91]PJA17369.1 MAG: glycogen synthase [Elusimicrobia bacterium CG_4_10_14_0_2_um_filter_63_34]PJB23626.1 MAG: glycogen synthase [Elusimicrobia bacterium CG_4_9_14_3_um_filter_62_55]